MPVDDRAGHGSRFLARLIVGERAFIRPCPNRAHPASSSRPARRTRIRRRRAAGAPAVRHALVDEARFVLRVVPPAGSSAARSGALGAAVGAVRAAAVGARRWHGFPPPGGGTDGRRMPEASLPPMTRISVIAGRRLFLHQAPRQGRVVLSQFEQRLRGALVAHQQRGSSVVLRPLS